MMILMNLDVLNFQKIPIPILIPISIQILVLIIMK